MGSINIDNTGSGGAITLSSDGTSLLLGGSAVGGSPDLYAENYDGTSTLPSATGTNSVAIGIVAVASGSQAMAFGEGSTASGNDSLALSDAAASANNTIAIGAGAAADSASGIAIGKVAKSFSSGVALGKDAQTNGAAAVSLGSSYNSGAGSFAAVIDNNTSSYGATGANSIAMGYQAKATGDDSIAIGEASRSFGTYRPLAVGYNAYASQSYSAAIGPYAQATASNATALGSGSTASGDYSIAIGDATADAYYSVAIGKDADTNGIRGKYAFACGDFSTNGDAQGGQFILRADTTDATATVLTTNNSTAGSTNQIVAASDTCITFDGTITAMQNGAQAYASWKIEGLLVNDGGTTTLANSATTVIQNLSSWGMALSADNTNNALAITCTGEASHNIRWVANIRTTEVTYA
jgi:hypothetical protein